MAQTTVAPNTSEVKSYVHHFGVSDKLLEAIKSKYASKWDKDTFVGQQTQFIDEFYDTSEFTLIQKNHWLRLRSFTDGKFEWSLKTKTMCCLVNVMNKENYIKF